MQEFEQSRVSLRIKVQNEALSPRYGALLHRITSIFRPDIELSDRTLLEHSGRHTVIHQTCMHTCRHVITLAQGAQWGSCAEMWVFFADIRLYAHMSVD